MGYFRIIGLLTVIFAGIVTFSPQTYASAFIDIFDKGMPVYEAIPLKEFQESGRVHTQQPLADEALSYELTLPKVWRETKSFGYSLSQDIFTDIGRYIGPVKFNKANSYIVVQALDVGLQASAKTMAAAHFMNNGFTVQGAHDFSRNDVETLHVEVSKGESYIVRSRFIINGGRLVMMSYYLPATSWNEERDLQFRVVRSFKLLNEVEAKIESAKTHEFWDVSSFKYPAVWTLEPGEAPTFDHMNVMLLNFDGDIKKRQNLVVKGRISVDLISRYVMPSLEDALVDQIDLMVSQGIVMKRKKEKFDAPVWPEVFQNASASVYEVLDSYAPDQKMELWVVGAQALGYYYVFSMVTPTRDEDFMLWGENTEALQYIIEHTVPGEEW